MEYNNWRMLTDEEIRQEWEWEYTRRWMHTGHFKTLEDFKRAVLNGRTEKITAEKDMKISRRSRCESIEDLEELTSGYIYPRDVDRIVSGFENNDAIPYPIVIETKDRRAVMSGNTRMDAAFIMGIEPVVLVISPEEKPRRIPRCVI